MRALMLIAAALALSACKNNSHVDNNQNVDESLTAENIVSNDVTAIDAVTGDAANMAAESAVNDIGDVSNETGNMDTLPPTKPPTVKTAPAKAAPPKSAPAVGNTVSNVATNGE